MKPQKFEFFGIQIPVSQLYNGINIMYYKDIDYGKMLLHTHDFIEIILVMEGEVSISHDGILYNMNPGDISIVPNGLFHNTIIHESTKKYERYVLHIDKNILHELTVNQHVNFEHYNTKVPIVFSCNADETFYSKFIFSQLFYNNSLDDKFSPIVILNTIYDLLVFFERKFLTPKFSGPRLSNELVSNIIEYINNNYTSHEINVEDIASLFYVSVGYLSKLFRRFTGTTVYNYIIEKRLSHSKKLISQGITIQEACYMSGFGDYTSFLKSFKKKFDITPTEFKVLKDTLTF